MPPPTIIILMKYNITDQKLFDSLEVSVDIVCDSIEIHYKQNNQRQTIEQWGHFGKDDFKDLGFEIIHGIK